MFASLRFHSPLLDLVDSRHVCSLVLIIDLNSSEVWVVVTAIYNQLGLFVNLLGHEK